MGGDTIECPLATRYQRQIGSNSVSFLPADEWLNPREGDSRGVQKRRSAPPWSSAVPSDYSNVQTPGCSLQQGVDAPSHQGLVMTYTKLVSKKELKSVFGIPYSSQHIARLEVAGCFPKRVQLGPCRVAWIADEVQDWMDRRVAQRSTSRSQ
jgi:prophage regulatory protein